MRVLIVGAGAIGQVFARHFREGGATVGFLVRPKYLEEAHSGFTLYPLNRPRGERHEPLRLDGCEVYADQAIALEHPWDALVIAVSATALRRGDWFSKLTGALPDTDVLAFVAGAEDPGFVTNVVPEHRLAWGMLSIISYQSPFPGDSGTPGVTYWFSWGPGIGFSGDPRVVDRLCSTLGAGGMPVHKVDDVRTEVAFMGPILSMMVLADECAGWSLRSVQRDPELIATAHQAMGECWTMAESAFNRPRPLLTRLLRPLTLKWVLGLASKLMPLDLERFFKFHYTKVRDQSLYMLDCRIENHAAAGIPNTALKSLRTRIIAARQST